MGYDWFKLYTGGVLRGTIVATMSYEEQLCWIRLLAFASECRDRGIIRRAKGLPFERKDLAGHIGMPEFLVNTTIEKCIKDENADDARTRIMILPDGSLQIANWEKYQSKPDKTQAKEEAIANAVDTKRLKEQAVEALARAVNQLNQGMKARRYEVTPDGKVLDTTTGEVKEVSEMQKGGDNNE